MQGYTGVDEFKNKKLFIINYYLNTFEYNYNYS